MKQDDQLYALRAGYGQQSVIGFPCCRAGGFAPGDSGADHPRADAQTRKSPSAPLSTGVSRASPPAGVRAEIILVDSSDDSTAEQAIQKGARVVKAPRRGLGRAYQQGIPAVRGKYVLMGDADCTYDFRQLQPFLDRFREGYEFVMGSRFSGFIEPGSMPALHRYFGTPFTTWILNLLYGTRFSDIHCGMRGITREALVRMKLQSDSAPWQYASEMVLKSVHMKLRTAEVPVRFLKDPDGRVSHHKRACWLSPWKAGWSNLEVMLTHGAEVFHHQAGVGDVDFGPFAYAAIEFWPYSNRSGGSIDVLDAVWADAFCFGRADGGVGMYHANSSRLSGRCDSAVAARVPV